MPPQWLQRRPAPESIQSLRLHAPVGGMNTVSPAGELPEGDCLYLYNMIGSEYGLRSRLGYQEWVTNLGAGASVPTVLPFTGSHKNGTTDALFGCTPQGIWGASLSTQAPTQLVTYAIQTGDAGYGVSVVAATGAGRFLVHCDEENGLHIYSENTATWAKILGGATVPWAFSTPYFAGDKVVNGVNTYICTAPGTSAVSGSGPTGTGTSIADGTVTWNFLAVFSATAIGPSLADQRNGFTALPGNFAAVTVFANRVWLVERNTSRAWYSGINGLYGTYTSFDFGPKMQHGGPLASLFNWSYDGGSGMSAQLVGISTAGDIVIYGGKDPSQSSTFGLVGSWFAGGVPYGRRIATDFGGDVLVLTGTGVLPLSKLVIGNPIVSRSVYTTVKISNLFNRLAQTYGTLQGWAIQLHPTDNALIVTVPQAAGQPTIQLAYSFATEGWSQYRGLPMLSAGVWNGQLYFGTVDGRLCVNTGYVDAVSLANPNTSTPVLWSLLTGFSNGGNSRNKKVQLVRPTVISETPNPIVQTTVKYGYDLSEPAAPSSSVMSQAPGTWDVAVWDVDIWSGDYTPSQPLSGALGMGRDVAISVEGQAVSRTILEGFDVLYETGGYL